MWGKFVGPTPWQIATVPKYSIFLNPTDFIVPSSDCQLSFALFEHLEDYLLHYLVALHVGVYSIFGVF